MADRRPRFDRSSEFPLSWGLSPLFVKGTVWLIAVIALAGLLVVHYTSPDQPQRLIGPIAEVCVAATTLVLLALGKIRLALTLLVSASWTIITTILIFYGGVRGTLVVFYPVIITLCGWLFGARRAIYLAFLSAVTTLTLLGVETAGILPTPPPTPAPIYGFIQILCIFFTAFLIYFLVRSYGRRIREVEILSRDLAASTLSAQSTAADLNVAQAVARTGSWVYDFASGRIEMSPETCRICDLPEGSSSTLGEYRARVHPADLAKFDRDWESAVRGDSVTNEHRIGSGQNVRWISQRVEMKFDGAGAPLRCVGTMQDVTQAKRTEEELRIAATAFEAQEGLVITDAAMKILRVNAAFSRITGYSIADVTGRSLRSLRSMRHERPFYSLMWKRIWKNGTWQGEIWNRRKNGEGHPGWLTVTGVTNAAGTVTHYVVTLTDITRRKAIEDEIKHLAFFDALTGLPNRRLLLDRLHQAMAASARSARQGALLYLDLDQFKILNDSQGHDKGDRLLQQVASRLSTCVREGDTVSRFGGDEFVIMLVNLSTLADESTVQAETVGQKILAALGRPYDLDGHENYTTTSIGVTLFFDQQTSPFELLKQADLAMYEAKAKGRNRICFYRAEMKQPPAPGARDRAST
jgi:diguanylate cyclase (GGDEF)-like protein/PAS domain S-box-containing protein